MAGRKPLTAQQLEAAELLSRGGKVGEVAESLGVGRNAVTNWRKRDDFLAEVGRLSRALQQGFQDFVGGGRKSMVELTPSAVKVVERLLAMEKTATDADGNDVRVPTADARWAAEFVLRGVGVVGREDSDGGGKAQAAAIVVLTVPESQGIIDVRRAIEAKVLSGVPLADDDLPDLE